MTKAAPLILLVCGTMALAAPARSASPDLTIHAVRLTSPVTLDGALNEPFWKDIVPATQFTQRDPIEGAAPTMRTEVRVAYDDDALYVGARMYDSAPDSIMARLSRRDVSVPADRFTMFIDPYHDRRTGYYFIVNAAGTLYDGTLYNDSWDDSSWDGVWEGRAKIDKEGWTCEMRIPFSQLRFENSGSYVWGINFRRSLQRRSEEDWIVYMPKKESGFVSRFPDLVGIESVAGGRAIELTPYVTSKAEYLFREAGDPFNKGHEYEPDGGADLRMSVGSKLTLNATVNPDFGQVEVDPAVVNLSDVESFFQEKRPFFVEGASIFNFGNQGANDYWGFNWPDPKFFYSRRVGRAPQGSLPNYDFKDAPIGTSILGAAKLTGKLSPSWSFGTMHALTARETADLDLAGTRSNLEIEPLTYYGVVRGLHEFKDRRQGFGLMSTLAQRSFDSSLRDQLNRTSLMAGFDGWTFLDKNQVWVISGWSAMSYVAGTQARLTALQENSRHYFQRPDADHVEVDPNATSLTGFGSRYWLNKQKGNSFCNAALGFMNPKFDVNDVGFQTRSDLINGHFGYGYKWTETTKARKYQDILGAAFASYDFQGNPIWGGLFAQGSTEFINNYSWNYETAYNPRTVNNRATRGGPLMFNRPGYEFSSHFDTDSKSKQFYFADGYTYFQESGAYNWNFAPGIEWKPVSNLLVRVGPSFERVHEDAQYLQTQDDATATATYGHRYVFAVLDQKTLAANIRVNWAFTPALSAQVFVQPLISVGDYSGFKELARGRSYAFNVYGQNGSTFDPSTGMVDPDGAGPAQAFQLRNDDFGFSGNPDFNFKSLRGNAVVRWEYLPGSTLYLVWTQGRSDTENLGDFNIGPDSHRLFAGKMDNIFLAKVTYYFNL